jgi:predicted glycoside hydrolase/deacetylase ChbG (UPF0249 family)
LREALIVNADDYGRTPGVSRGIREAHQRGIVTSSSIMMNMPHLEEDLHLAKVETLCSPKQVPSLVDGEGKFWKLHLFSQHLDRINPDEVRLEWQSQTDLFRSLTGKPPTHFDSHQHTSYFTPEIFRLMLEMAQEEHCAIRTILPPAGDPSIPEIPQERVEKIKKAASPLLVEFRVPTPRQFLGTFYDTSATRETLKTLIQSLGEGVSELMCHPGYADPTLLAESSYNHKREDELKLLTDPEIAATVQEHDIQLINFGDLVQYSGNC